MKKQVIRLFLAAALIFSCSMQAFALPDTLIPGGCTIGIKLCSKGLIVTGFEESSAAQAAGLRKGDVIIKANGEWIHTASSLRERLTGSDIVLTVRRQGKAAEFCVKPTKTEYGPRIGAFVRDTMAGIGTVTYYDPDTGSFGALGHGVSDADTAMLMPMEVGVVVHSSVANVEKSSVGKPGELKGKFDVHRIMGSVAQNTERGIFGKLTDPIPGEPIPVGCADDTSPGQAVILSNISGTNIRSYSAEIVRIYPHATDTGRNMLIRITDPQLISATGGIVQGMSGSPIIQDGKLVGAVTHVLVNDPTTGYGIFIENILDAAA